MNLDALGDRPPEGEPRKSVEAVIVRTDTDITVGARFPDDSASLANFAEVGMYLKTPCTIQAAEQLLASQDKVFVWLPNLDFAEAERRIGVIPGRQANFRDSGDAEAYLLCALQGAFSNEGERTVVVADVRQVDHEALAVLEQEIQLKEALNERDQAEANRLLKAADFSHPLFATGEVPPSAGHPAMQELQERAWRYATLHETVIDALNVVKHPEKLRTDRLKELAPKVIDYYERERLAGTDDAVVTHRLRKLAWALKTKRGSEGVDFL